MNSVRGIDEYYIEKAGNLSSSYKTKIKMQDWLFDTFDFTTNLNLNSRQKMWTDFKRIASNDSIGDRWRNVWGMLWSNILKT